MDNQLTWEGAPRLGDAWKLVQSLDAARTAGQLTPEQDLVASRFSSGLRLAHPIVVPASQVGAVPDELFADTADALRYGAEARLPFEAVLFDFSEVGGGSIPLLVQEIPLAPDQESPGLKLHAALAVEEPNGRLTTWMPIIASESDSLRLPGWAVLNWDGEETDGVSRMRVRGLDVGPILSFSPRAIGEIAGKSHADNAPAVLVPAPGLAGGDGSPTWDGDSFLPFLAAVTAAATTTALKALYLLDSANVNLAEAKLSRQVGRAAKRRGARVASIIQIKPPRSRRPSRGNTQEREFSHRFEVRGNFAHYGPGTELFRRSEPDAIKPCPRCGECRRVWRPPHVKGPEDKPLVPKTRHIDAEDHLNP